MVPIVYGYPNPELWERAEAGEAVIGGCVVESTSPSRVCRNCGKAR
jgi:hypothetical protein